MLTSHTIDRVMYLGGEGIDDIATIANLITAIINATTAIILYKLATKDKKGE